MSALIEQWPIEKLIPYARNSRRHSDEQVAQIAASIDEFGMVGAIVVRDGVIAKGHGTLSAMRQIYGAGKPVYPAPGKSVDGIKPYKKGTAPVINVSGWTDAQFKAFVIADNQLALNAGWDEEMLALELADLSELGFDLSLTGFNSDEIDDMLAADAPPSDPLVDPDTIPETPEIPHSKLGDLWIMGKHRLICGDSLSVDAIDRLMEGHKADMVFTDPPYLMDFTGAIDGAGNQRSKHDRIANDKMSKKDGEKFLRDIASMIRLQCQGAWYVCFYRLGIDWIMNAMTDAGIKWRNLIIWKKNHLNLSNSDYKALYEPIVYGWQNDAEPILYGWNLEHEFEGPKGEVDVWENGIPSVWEIDRTKNNDRHPTMKPVALVERAIINSSRPGDIVLDLFGGSGTTLIAAETTGRVARLSELEPKYVDVICQRYFEVTGRVPVHEETGEEFPVHG